MRWYHSAADLILPISCKIFKFLKFYFCILLRATHYLEKNLWCSRMEKVNLSLNLPFILWNRLCPLWCVECLSITVHNIIIRWGEKKNSPLYCSKKLLDGECTGSRACCAQWGCILNKKSIWQYLCTDFTNSQIPMSIFGVSKLEDDIRP
jgi:hypothetical protein